MARLYTFTRPTLRIEHRVRGSRFIAQAVPATSQEEVSKILRGVRESMPDATHICYAYRLMPQGDEPEEFANDAGEPGGSAGVPMLNVLRKAGLMDVVAWVARYFGGTKLGIPGLMTAYAQAVRMTLQDETPVPWIAMTGVRVSLSYALVERVKGEIEIVGGSVMSEDYSQQVVLYVSVPREAEEGFLNRLEEWGAGKIKVTLGAIDFNANHD